MKRIGSTTTGNVIVEMTADEFDSLDLEIRPKPQATPSAKPEPKSIQKPMSLKELVEYAIPRIQKSHPKKKASLAKFLEAMFKLHGGIEESKIEQIIEELKKRKMLKEVEGKITY
jgi:hypothetical protein